MSAQSPFGGRMAARHPTLPKGDVVATFETYAEAQSAVDALARADFPVKQVSIVGSDLKTVERVTGRMSYGRAAAAGAASGAWLGVFFGLLMFIFLPTTGSLSIVLAAVLIGAGFGALFGVVTYSLGRRRRDFTSTMQVIASSYSLIVDPEGSARARNLLGETHAGATIERPAPQPTAEPAPAPVPRPDED